MVVMVNPVKEKITISLDKAKGEGKVRADHIREIVKLAVLQTVAELKEGSGEIGSIVKEAIFTAIADLKGKGIETTEKITASIEGAIEGSTYERQKVIAGQRAKLQDLQDRLDEEQQILDREISGVLIDIQAGELDGSMNNSSEEINSAVKIVQESQDSGILKDRYMMLKSQLLNLDEKLATRYGDRYAEVKQQWENLKTWYDQKKTEADATGTIPLHQKQAEIEDNFGEFGSVVAQKEQQVKQRIKELWGSKGLSNKS
jgi:hypothetical protein